MIDVRGLQYTYLGADRPAIRGLNFSVSPGEVFGFLGPGGAGKSTTQKVLFGLLDDYSGEATVFSREVREWGARTIRADWRVCGVTEPLSEAHWQRKPRTFASPHSEFVREHDRPL